MMVIGNWKMNPSTAKEAKDVFTSISKTSAKFKNVDVILCPPSIYLESLNKYVRKNLLLGAQNVFWENGTRSTGEISPEMLKSLGVSVVIVGHSERRAMGESDITVSQKVIAGLREGLRVVICVGELERDSSGGYFEFLKNQIKHSCAGIQRRYVSDLIIAYEPVWAVGRSWKEAMASSDIKETVIFIRKTLSDIYDQECASSIPIIYGGSVELENAYDVFVNGGVSGVLVGHKSLVPADFVEIIKCADEL